jgi:hypothetical protein
VRQLGDGYLKELRQNPNQTVYAVVRSSGLVGFCNEGAKGLKRDRRLMRPAYRLIRFGVGGNITSLSEIEVDSLRIREEVRRDFGELPATPVSRLSTSPGPKYFEVWPWARDEKYYWLIKDINTVDKRLITAIRIKTDVPFARRECLVIPKETPLPGGWKLDMVHSATDGMIVLRFSAVRRKAGIGTWTMPEWGQVGWKALKFGIEVTVEAVRKYGELSVAWDMDHKNWSRPAIVQVPSTK